jgi:hypothetical protein
MSDGNMTEFWAIPEDQSRYDEFWMDRYPDS